MRNAKPVPMAHNGEHRRRPVLPARPRKAATDYEALGKDILKRYPKVMAELAK